MRAAAVAAISLLALSAAAQTDRPPPQGPPPEAYAACATKAQGDACSVSLRDATVTGVCAQDLQSQSLFCRPDRPPPGPHGPPPEAIAACSGKADGASCSAALPDGSMRSGTCKAGPGQQLACLPQRN